MAAIYRHHYAYIMEGCDAIPRQAAESSEQCQMA